MRDLPMFPLGTVLFPFAELPLHVFEPRYRMLTHDVLRGDREFGVVLIERGHEVGGGDRRFHVGCVASVVQARELADGRWAIGTVGIERIRVEQWLDDDPYPRARVETLAEAPLSAAAGAARDRLASSFAALVEVAARLSSVSPDAAELSTDPARASFEAAARARIGALDSQRVLEADDVVDRIELLIGFISEHTELLRRRLA